MKQIPIVVMFSGTGSTMQALIEQQHNYKIVATVCNKPDAGGIQLAKAANIPCIIIDHKQFASREEFELEILRQLHPYKFELIVLAGFMRILSAKFVKQFPEQIINIHPSLLPKYPGLNTYAKALANGDSKHGTTIHYVTEVVDSGAIIDQETVSILADDSIESLQQKTKAAEQQLYPRVINDLVRIIGEDTNN